MNRAPYVLAALFAIALCVACSGSDPQEPVGREEAPFAIINPTCPGCSCRTPPCGDSTPWIGDGGSDSR